MAKTIKDRAALKADRKAAKKAARQADFTAVKTAINNAITGATKRDFMKSWYHKGKHTLASFTPYVALLSNLPELQKLLVRDFPDKLQHFCNVFGLTMPTSDLVGATTDTTFFSDFLTPAQEEDQRDIDEVDNVESVEVHSLTQWLKLTFPNYTQPQIDVIIKTYTNYNDEVIVKRFLQVLGTDRLTDFVNTKMPEMATEILSLF